MNNKIQEIIEVMKEMLDDDTIPKSVRTALTNSISILDNYEGDNLTITKVLDELEEITEDSNLESYIRTQIWDLVRLLEETSITNN